MKKVEKGKPGYLNYKKKAEILRTVIYFAIVAAIFLLGYTQTHTRLNLMTVVAVLGCLPASKALVGVITRFPYPSIDPDRGKGDCKNFPPSDGLLRYSHHQPGKDHAGRLLCYFRA